MKVDVENFSNNNLLQDFKFIKRFVKISSNIHRYFNNTFHKFKILKKVIKTGTFNVDFIISK